MNDASFPWLIAVPRHAGAVEIFDLGEAERAQLMSELALEVTLPVIPSGGAQSPGWGEC